MILQGSGRFLNSVIISNSVRFPKRAYIKTVPANFTRLVFESRHHILLLLVVRVGAGGDRSVQPLVIARYSFRILDLGSRLTLGARVRAGKARAPTTKDPVTFCPAFFVFRLYRRWVVR